MLSALTNKRKEKQQLAGLYGDDDDQVGTRGFVHSMCDGYCRTTRERTGDSNDECRLIIEARG